MGDNPKKSSDSPERSRSSADQDESADREAVESPPRKPQPESSPIDIKGTQNKAGQQSSSASTEHPCHQDGIMRDANGEPIPLDQIIKTANTMSNMLMAHKIALEDNFRLEPGMDISGPLMSLSPIIGSSSPPAGASRKAEPNLQSKVKDIVHEAYWDLFKEELENQASEHDESKKHELSKQLLRDIKQKMIDLLLPQHSRLKQDIEDRLDSTTLDQLSKVDSLDLLDYARYILSVLGKLCAPVRDEKLKELSETNDLVQVYRGIMELLELMRLDFANFTLDRFKPHIKAHSQEYEREKFNEILKQQQSIGIDGLEYTKIWLGRAVQRVEEQHGLSDLMNETKSLDVSQGEMSSALMMTTESGPGASEKKDKLLRSDIVNKILNMAYCELLEWSPDKQKLFPETLLFDEATFRQLGEQYKVLVLTSSILLATFAFVSKFKLQDTTEFRTLIKSHVITLLTATYDSQTPQADSDSSKLTSSVDRLDQAKLETVAQRLIEDIRLKLIDDKIDKSLEAVFEHQKELFKRQILDIQNESNRVRELARRRILEFVDTLLTLDVKQQQNKFPSKMPPPISIPLGLNCLADEMTLTMAQLVKIIRYNRRVFFQHYQDIIIELALKVISPS